MNQGESKTVRSIRGRVLRWLFVLAVFILVLSIVQCGEDPERSRQCPSDQALLADFHNHRAQLDRLASMATADSRLMRVADDWYIDAAGADHRKPQPRLLSAARWDEYRRLFRDLHLQEGVLIWPGGIEFLSFCEGLAGSGDCKGFALLRKTPAAEEICGNLDRLPMRKTPLDGICYRQIEGPWYLFREWM
jgi:hypothetical protein